MASNGEGLMGLLRSNAHVARARLGRVSDAETYDSDNNVIVEDVGPVEGEESDPKVGIREMMARISSGREIDIRRVGLTGCCLVVLLVGGLFGYRAYFSTNSVPAMVNRPAAAGNVVASKGIPRDGMDHNEQVAGLSGRYGQGVRSVPASGKAGAVEGSKGDSLIDRGVDDSDRVAKDDRDAGVVSGQVVDVALSDKVDTAIAADRMPFSDDLLSFGLRSPESASR